MTGSYTPTGPFNSTLPPAITAGFLNNVEAWIKQVDNTNAVTQNGTTAGTASLYQFLQGTIKGFVLYLNAYRNATTTEQTVSLPVPFTTRANFFSGNIGINMYKSGAKLTSNVAVITSIASSGGTATVTTLIPQLSIGELAPPAGFDALGLNTSMASTATGLLFVIGI